MGNRDEAEKVFAYMREHKDDAPEIGKDGKWQLDVFDPDLSRVELMEFKPTQKPCCSDFTGPHPAESAGKN